MENSNEHEPEMEAKNVNTDEKKADVDEQAESPADGTPDAAADEPAAEAAAGEAPPAEPDWKDRYARALADFDNFRKPSGAGLPPRPEGPHS